MRIGLDVDGVLADFPAQYSRYYNRLYGAAEDFSRSTAYCYTEKGGELWKLGGFYSDIPVMPGAREAVSAMRDAGHSLAVVTATPAYAAADRTRWLGTVFGFREGDIMFVTEEGKPGLCKRGFDILVDDRPGTCLALPPDRVFVFEWPYNRHLLGMGYAVGRFDELGRFLRCGKPGM